VTERLSRPIIGYASYFKLLNGFEKIYYMTLEELNHHGLRFSQTFKKGFGLWKDDFDSMARKTVIKLNLSKNAPLSVEMQKAIVTDQAIVNDGDTEDVEYVDNDPEENRIDGAITNGNAAKEQLKTGSQQQIDLP
jgi:recombination protein RecT